MILQDKKKNCYYEFNPQLGCFSKSEKFEAFYGKRGSANGRSLPVIVLLLRNVQSLNAMAMRDAYNRQLSYPELPRIYSYIEVRDQTSRKWFAYFILERVDGVPLDKFVTGNIQGVSPSSSTSLLGLYSDYTGNPEKFSTNLIIELSNIVERLNNNDFSVADLRPSSIMVTSNGSIKLLDYGLPVGKISISHEISMLGRMLYFMLQGNEYTGGTRIKSSKLQPIIKKAIEKKYQNTQSFRKAFEHKTGWWKIVVGFLIAILIILVFVLWMAHGRTTDSPDNVISGTNDGGNKKKPDVEIQSGETDYKGGFEVIKSKEQKGRKAKEKKIIENKETDKKANSDIKSEKSNKENQENASIKDIVL